jgi:hypothetical protein
MAQSSWLPGFRLQSLAGSRRGPLQKGVDTRPALAVRYFAGAALALAAALALGGPGLILGWDALALALVAFNYAWAGAAGFQKNAGRRTLAARWLFAPYTHPLTHKSKDDLYSVEST